MSDSTVRMRLKLPRELYQDVATDAKIHCHRMSQEIIDKLQISVDENDIVMVNDRLQRLIFAKALAHPALP
jgi:hypothetical protein